VNFDIWDLFGYLSPNANFGLNGTILSGILHQDLSTFVLLTEVWNILYFGNNAD